MSEYDLKKSKKIGQLYPVLVDVEGKVIDGFHRLEVDPNWKKERLEGIDSEEKLLIARSIANWHRRQVSREEKEEWINGLAVIYKKQGLKVRAKNRTNEIVDRIVEVTGLTPHTVREYLKDTFRQTEHAAKEQPPRVSASQRIYVSFKAQKGEAYAKQLVERHREEVLVEERPKIEEEVREELSRDTEFIKEAIEKAPEVLPTLPKKTIERAKKAIEPLTKEMGVKEGTVYTVGEYECPHCKKHYLIKCNGKKDWVE